MRWALRGDSMADVAWIGGLFVAFLLTNRLTTAASGLTLDDGGEPLLFLAALRRNPAAAVLLIVLVACVAIVGRSRFTGRWSQLEHGSTLRMLTMVLVVMVAWRYSAYEQNYVVAEWHWADRALILLLAIAVFFRPMFLVPFVFAARVVGQQFGAVAGLSSTENITKLLLVVLLAIAAMHLTAALSNDRRTSTVWLLISAAFAAQFFRPGIGKVRLGWLFDNEIENFAMAGYTAGWQGAGDGSWADRVADGVAPVRVLVLAATLVVELGSIVAAMHYRLLRLWLPAVVGFHGVVFAFTGFWFGEWIVLELAVIWVLTRPGSNVWLEANVTPLRMGVVFVAVGLGSTVLFQVPGLAWFDAKVAYGYSVDATLADGREVSVALGAFAPFAQDLAFAELQFTEVRSASSGYGSVFSSDRRVALEETSSFGQLVAYEQTLDPVPEAEQQVAHRFVMRWLDYANADPERPAWLLAPLPYFWTSAPEPTFEFGDRITELTVTRKRSIHAAESMFHAEVVFRAGVDVDGNAIALPLAG